jgi:hypothetical protein
MSKYKTQQKLLKPIQWTEIDESEIPTGGEGKARVWFASLDPLRARPGQWVKGDETYEAGTASRIRRGEYAGIRRGEFDAKIGPKNTEGRIELYVKFIGSEGR